MISNTSNKRKGFKLPTVLIVSALLVAGTTGCSSSEYSNGSSAPHAPAAERLEKKFVDSAAERRANDAAVESDVRNIATAIESALVADPNATDFKVEISDDNVIVVTTGKGVTNPVSLNEGVHVRIMKSEGLGPDDPVYNGYIIQGWHDNGDNYTSEDTAAIYDSQRGGFI